MKKIVLFVCLCCGVTAQLFGQTEYVFDSTFNDLPVTPYPVDPICDSIRQERINQSIRDCDVQEIVIKRKRSLDFFKTLNMLAEPSTISWWGTDHTYYFDRKNQKKAFLLNADICIPISLGGKRWLYNTVQVIPQFKVRIFRDDSISHDDRSSPVRTPSYLPAITYYFSFRDCWRYDEVNGNRGFYFGLKAFHHSNGQDGSEFLADGSINVYNGNFGEQLVGELLVGYTREYNTMPPALNAPTLDNQRTQRGRTLLPNRLWYLRASFEWHEPTAVTNQDFRQYTLYGQNRLNIQFGHLWYVITRDLILCKDETRYIAVTPAEIKERFRLVVNVNYILDQYYHTGDRVSNELQPMFSVKRLNLNVTGYYRIPGAPYAAMFWQFSYYGSDNYNIYFQQSFFQSRFGLALAFFKYPRSGDYQDTSYAAVF